MFELDKIWAEVMPSCDKCANKPSCQFLADFIAFKEEHRQCIDKETDLARLCIKFEFSSSFTTGIIHDRINTVREMVAKLNARLRKVEKNL